MGAPRELMAYVTNMLYLLRIQMLSITYNLRPFCRQKLQACCSVKHIVISVRILLVMNISMGLMVAGVLKLPYHRHMMLF